MGAVRDFCIFYQLDEAVILKSDILIPSFFIPFLSSVSEGWFWPDLLDELFYVLEPLRVVCIQM